MGAEKRNEPWRAYLRTHWASVSGFCAAIAVVGFFLSTCCSGLMPVARSVPHLHIAQCVFLDRA